MFCAISGEAAQNPVVNKKTGAVYEKNLIHKYLADNGNKDPVTSEELTLDDLVEVKTSPSFTPARPPSHSSLPSLLSTLQSEYDSLILETYALKRNYDSVRQELAHALYANDAANRVVARLIGERDGAREALAQIQNTLGVSGGNSVGAEDSEMTDGNAVGGQGSLDSETRETIQASVTKLSAARKGRSKRKAPASYASANDVKSFDQVSALPSLHSTKPPGVTCMDLSSNGQFLVTGGNDSQINVYDLSTSKLVSNLKGHGKKISKVFFSKTDDPLEVGPNAGNEGKPEFIVSSSELDKSVKIWKLIGNGNEENSGYEIKDAIKLDSEISGLALHPCGRFFGLTTRNGNFSLYSLDSSKLLLSLDAPNASSVSSEESLGGYKYSSLAFHPDGQLFSIGTSEGIIRIFDLFSSSNVSNFRSQDYETLGEINSMNFSENGYFFVVSSKNSKDVKVWDLRKQEVVGVLESENGGINEVVFDPSANFVAVLGNDVRVFNNKSWNLLKVYDGNTNSLSSGRWNPKDGSLLVTGIDRTLRVLGKAKEE